MSLEAAAAIVGAVPAMAAAYEQMVQSAQDIPTKYVVGFYFDNAKSPTRVVMMEKAKPEWQRGKYNGVGGKVKEGESIDFAMHREFREETGIFVHPQDWHHFVHMEGSSNGNTAAVGTHFEIDFFWAAGNDITTAAPQPGELEWPRVCWLRELDGNHRAVLENIPWLIPLAIDNMKDGRPSFAVIYYR